MDDVSIVPNSNTQQTADFLTSLAHGEWEVLNTDASFQVELDDALFAPPAIETDTSDLLEGITCSDNSGLWNNSNDSKRAA